MMKENIFTNLFFSQKNHGKNRYIRIGLIFCFQIRLALIYVGELIMFIIDMKWLENWRLENSSSIATAVYRHVLVSSSFYVLLYFLAH